MDGDDDDDNDDDDDGECGIIGIPRCGAVTLSQTVQANIRQLENLSFNILLIKSWDSIFTLSQAI